jgi:hypothetical protein
MKAASEVFMHWLSDQGLDEVDNEDAEFLQEAFEAGMVAGIMFLKTQTNAIAEEMIEDYAGFDAEDDYEE